MDEINDNQLRVFLDTKIKILQLRPMDDRLELINSESYFEMMKTFESQSESKMKSATFIIKRYITNMKTLLLESSESIIDKHYENNWTEIVETNSKLFYSMITDILNFFYDLLKERICKLFAFLD